MTSPIIVATDFSARADRAIDRALILGKQMGRTVKLLHAVERRREDSDQGRLDALMENALPEGFARTDQVEFVYTEGSPPRAIAEAAEELDAALVVMGPARLNSIGDFFLGTAVDYALRHCERPVLVVKRRPHRPYSTIVTATDFSAPSANALRLALEWFPEAAHHLVHACHIPWEGFQRDLHVKDDVLEAERLRMGDFLAENAFAAGGRAAPEPHVVLGGPHQAMAQVVRETGADLAVLGSHGEGGFRHATIGSMANQLLETIPADTLMVVARR